MAKRKITVEEFGTLSEGQSAANPAGNGSPATGNKMDAVRTALRSLGKTAKPAQIRVFVQDHFGIDMKPNMISAYKSMLAKRGGKKGRPGRKPRYTADETADTSARGGVGGAASMKELMRDIRTLKELSDRHGPTRLRELLELMGQ